MIADFECLTVLSGAAPRAPSRKRVTPVHAAVPGRARLMIAGLRHNSDLQRALEARLAARPRIHAANANSLSGNVLVRFDPEMELTELVTAIEAVLDGQFPPAPDLPGAAAPPCGEANDPVEAWHAAPVQAVLDRFGTSPSHGLSAAQLAGQRARHGANILPAPAGRTTVALLLEQVTSLPVMMLLASALVSIATGGLFDAILVLSVVVANGSIGYVTTRQAERMIRSLAEAALPPVHVVRAGRAELAPAHDIVPGDLLLLGPGSIVPADARVIESAELGADESALTGESMAVGKSAEPVPAATMLAERVSMIHRGSTIVRGRGKAVVTTTGLATALGAIQSLASTARPPPTPVERELNQLGHWLGIASLLACGGVLGIGLLRGYDALTVVRTSIALAVAAVPEGLPTVATVTLALGIGRMRKLNVFVRRLDAIETLGAVNVICFDKTGTLTENRMSIRRLVAGGRRVGYGEPGLFGVGRDGAAPEHPELRRLLEVAALCNDAEPASGERGAPSGSPTECALLAAASAAGIDVPALRAACPADGRLDRAPGRSYMSTIHRTPSGRLVAVKGNPDEVLALCDRHLVGGQETILESDDRARIEFENEELAAEGLRVLGFAAGAGDSATNLVWLGLAGMADPVRPGMRELMHRLHRAGVDTIMITGDQSMTAYTVAKELDLSGGRPIEILEGPHIDALPAEALTGLAPRAHVFARVSPEHKLQIVQALQRAGKVVAMTGDGINDSPALRAADIGLAMGRSGTDAAREMADLVLADDNLATMEVAIREGRTIHGSIKKSVRYLLSTNLSEIALATMAVGLGLGQPLAPAQLLWLNLVSDVAPALALGMEPPEADVLLVPPRGAQAPLFALPEAGRMAAEGTLIGASALAGHIYGLGRLGGPNGGGISFLACVIAQLLHGWSSRSPYRPLLGARLPPNRHLTLALAGLGGLQALAAVLPFSRRMLGIGSLDLPALGALGLFGGVPFVVNEALKSLWPAAPAPTLAKGDEA